MPINKAFQVDLGLDSETGEWHAHLYSLDDKKVIAFKGSKFGPIAKRAIEMVRKKELHNRKFPVPVKEPTRLLTLNGDRNGTNGHMMVLPDPEKAKIPEKRIIIP